MPTIHRQRVTGSLTAASAIFNFHFHFWSNSRIHILPAVGDIDCMKMACSKFTAQRKANSENLQVEEEWTEKLAFSLQPAQDPCA